MKTEVLMEYARRIASIRIRLKIEDGAYKVIASGIEQGIKEVMLRTAHRLKTLEDLPITGETISGAMRDVGVRMPRYRYVQKLEPAIKRAVVPSAGQVMQHIVSEDALQVLSEFVVDIEAAMLEEAERLARQAGEEEVTTKDIAKVCENLGKWLGC